MFSNTHCPESQCGDQPLQSCVFFERKEPFALKLKSECIRIYIVRKVNVAINPFRAAFFFERKERFAWKLKSECFRIYILQKANMAINPFRAAVFFENRECPSRKLKKIAYVSFSGEMKSECIRIYIVVVTRTDCLHDYLLGDLIFKVINLCFR